MAFSFLVIYYYYRSGTVNSNTVNSKFHLIRSYCEIFFYHFPNISCLKCTVNLNFHLIRRKILLTNDFELTVPNLYYFLQLHFYRKVKNVAPQNLQLEHINLYWFKKSVQLHTFLKSFPQMIWNKFFEGFTDCTTEKCAHLFASKNDLYSSWNVVSCSDLMLCCMEKCSWKTWKTCSRKSLYETRDVMD